MDDLVGRLASAWALYPLLFWVFGSVAAYATASNGRWLVRSREWWRSPSSRWLVQVGRFFFYLGIPYLALGGWPRQPYQGYLSLADLGLVGLTVDWPVTRWLGSVGLGLGLGLVALLILAFSWLNANRSAADSHLRFPPRPWWMLVVDGLYLQVHWAFYRGGLAVVLDDLYAGVFLSLGLVYLEWGLNPFWRRDWRLEPAAAGRWLQAALALVAALVFLLTRNLWICLGIHWLLVLVLWQMGSAREADGEDS